MLKILITFYKFVLKKKFWYAIFMVVNTASVVAFLLQPYFYKRFVDAIQAFDNAMLFRLLVAYTAVRMVGLILANMKYYLGDRVAVDTSIDVRTSVFRHIQNLDFAFHNSKSTGSLISAFKRGDGAFWNLWEKLHYRVWEVFIGFSMMLYYFSSLDIRIVGIAVLSFAITLLLTKFLVGYNLETRTIFNEWEDRISAIIVDNMVNFETVKLFAKENWELERLESAFKKWKHFLWKHFISYRVIDMSVGSLGNVAIFAILFLSMNLASGVNFSIGDFVLVSTFLGIFFPALFELIYGLRDIAKNYTDINIYFGVLDNEIKIKDPVKPVNISEVLGQVELHNVTFDYADGYKGALKNINLKVKPGESIALVGRSGAGKTTFIKLLLRFYDVTNGKITIDGVDIRDFTKSTLRSFFGVVPQEPILFNNTIGYNIGYGKENATKKEIKAAARLANIDRFIETLPKKYEANVGERGIKLSGGQKQRVAIARMILSDPQIVIFDEATSHLDSESEKLIQEAFWKAVHGKTTFIIAHRLSTVMKADRIVVLENGRIKEVGTHKDLLNNKRGLYKHLWDLQVG